MDGPAYPNTHTPKSCHTGQNRPFENTMANKKTSGSFTHIGVLINNITFHWFC